MTIDKIQFSHSAYVQWLKQTSGFRASFIATHLRNHCMQQSEAAFKTMEELGFEKFTEGCWALAGEMILANEKIEL